MRHARGNATLQTKMELVCGLMLSRMTVWFIPAPLRVIPFVMVRVLVQSHVPPGICTISPSDAAAMALRTSVCEQLGAVIVAASTCNAIFDRVKTAREPTILTKTLILALRP